MKESILDILRHIDGLERFLRTNNPPADVAADIRAEISDYRAQLYRLKEVVSA